MKITRVSTVTVDAGDRDWIFIRVDTDLDGLHGWGEASLSWHTGSVCGMVEDLAPLLIGEDPGRIEHLWQMMYRGPFFKGGIVGMSAIAGIDQALWDIKAKSLGVPLYELLGGAVRDRIRAYTNLGSELGGEPRDPAAWTEAALGAVEAGYDAMKVYPIPAGRALEGLTELREAVRLVEAVRDAAGEEVDLMVDLHGRSSQAMAIQYGRALEPLRPWWIEEPCQPGNPAAMAEVARALSTPVATGERLCSRFEFREYFEQRACAIAQPDVCYCGGISEYRRIEDLASAHSVAIAPHNPNGPVATMVSIHLAASSPGFLILEQVRGDVPWRDDLVDHPPVTKGGYAELPTRPGIGLDLVDEIAKQRPARSPAPHLLFARDGALVDW